MLRIYPGPFAHGSHAPRLQRVVRAFSVVLFLLLGCLTFAVATPVWADEAIPTGQTDPLLPILSNAAGYADPAYHARVAGDGVVAGNPEQALHAAFDTAGLKVTVAGQSWSMKLAAYGYGDDLAAVASGRPHVDANRVEIDHGTLVEWYLNGPWGLEQGFTLSAPPVGAQADGMLTLRLTHTGGIATVDAAGHDMTVTLTGGHSLRYTGLTAVDATGRSLPAQLIAGAHGALDIRIDDSGATYPLVIDPFIQYAKLTAPSPTEDGGFGSAVAVSNDIVVVGAPGALVGVPPIASGAVYVFARAPSSWQVAITPSAVSTASDGLADDNFGAAVAVSNNIIVVGAPYATVGMTGTTDTFVSGAVYLFEKPVSGWVDATEDAKLQVGSPQDNMYLGGAVGVYGNVVVAGAVAYDTLSVPHAGGAFIFEKDDDAEDGSDWRQTATLERPPRRRMGTILAIVWRLGMALW